MAVRFGPGFAARLAFLLVLTPFDLNANGLQGDLDLHCEPRFPAAGWSGNCDGDFCHQNLSGGMALVMTTNRTTAPTTTPPKNASAIHMGHLAGFRIYRTTGVNSTFSRSMMA